MSACAHAAGERTQDERGGKRRGRERRGEGEIFVTEQADHLPIGGGGREGKCSVLQRARLPPAPAPYAIIRMHDYRYVYEPRRDGHPSWHPCARGIPCMYDERTTHTWEYGAPYLPIHITRLKFGIKSAHAPSKSVSRTHNRITHRTESLGSDTTGAAPPAPKFPYAASLRRLVIGGVARLGKLRGGAARRRT